MKHFLPERDKVGVAERRDKQSEDELPYLGAPVHIPPPDLRQQTLTHTHTHTIILFGLASTE